MVYLYQQSGSQLIDPCISTGPQCIGLKSDKVVPIFISNTELRVLCAEFSQLIGMSLIKPKQIHTVECTAYEVPRSHGIVRDRGQLPPHGTDSHIRIDLIKHKDNTFSSIGRIRLVLTKHKNHELHVKVADEEHGQGYGILLYVVACTYAQSAGMILVSSTHPSVQAHRVYMSARIKALCNIKMLFDRYQISLNITASEVILLNCPSLMGNSNEFDYEKALLYKRPVYTWNPNKRYSTHQVNHRRDNWDYSDFYGIPGRTIEQNNSHDYNQFRSNVLDNSGISRYGHYRYKSIIKERKINTAIKELSHDSDYTTRFLHRCRIAQSSHWRYKQDESCSTTTQKPRVATTIRASSRR